jgi:hypothetical protein
MYKVWRYKKQNIAKIVIDLNENGLSEANLFLKL